MAKKRKVAGRKELTTRKGKRERMGEGKEKKKKSKISCSIQFSHHASVQFLLRWLDV